MDILGNLLAELDWFFVNDVFNVMFSPVQYVWTGSNEVVWPNYVPPSVSHELNKLWRSTVVQLAPP